MSVLAIDYGDRRIGLAVSNELRIVAAGLPTLRNQSEQQVLDDIGRLMEEREVREVVIGLPRNMDGTLGPQAQKVMAFAERVKALGKPVHFMDERLTSARARRVLAEAGLSPAKQRGRVDRMAAQFILQAWLDAARNPGRDP